MARIYHEEIIHALGDYAGPTLSKVAVLINRLTQWRISIDLYYKSGVGSRCTRRQIEESLTQLNHDVRALRVENEPPTQVISRAIELLLCLSWPQQNRTDIRLLSDELKEGHCRLRMRPCGYMNATSSYLMLGTISAGQGTPTRAWYMEKRESALSDMQMRGWGLRLRRFGNCMISDKILKPLLEPLWTGII